MAMRNYYDKTHIRKWFSPGDHVYLRLDNGYNIQANQGGPASRSVRVVKWAEVEKQLRKWCNLLRIGKKITIEIAFTYREDDSNYIPPSRKVEKRGRVSATSRMLAEREAHIVAEEEVTGQPST